MLLTRLTRPLKGAAQARCGAVTAAVAPLAFAAHPPCCQQTLLCTLLPFNCRARRGTKLARCYRHRRRCACSPAMPWAQAGPSGGRLRRRSAPTANVFVPSLAPLSLQGDLQFDADGMPVSTAGDDEDDESAGGSNSWGRGEAAPRRLAAADSCSSGSGEGLEAENRELRSRLKAVESVSWLYGLLSCRYARPPFPACGLVHASGRNRASGIC
jgi:hypothetical protein